jgi:hypothetical protein
MKRIVYFLISGLCILPAMDGRELNYGGKILPPTNPNTADVGKVLNNCGNTTTSTDLQINNVRARLFTKGDMWWDLNQSNGRPVYIVPKNGVNQASALFGGVIWFGGRDAGKNLKVAAMTYRSGNRVDFWPGPLIPRTLPNSGTTDANTCNDYDKFYNLKKRDVKLFVEQFEAFYEIPANAGQPYPNDIPTTILNWPGNFPVNTPNPLAPFLDRNGNGIYEPLLGDYPQYDLALDGQAANCLAFTSRFMYGDETVFWVFNDAGNTKTGSNTPSIGMEIRSQGFAYQTNDELNDMTFYSHELVNKGGSILDSTFFGVWTDADLGGPQDDYIGCDAENGFGFLYNADNFDADASGSKGYLDFLPAVGIDFFRGPFKDTADWKDLNGDGDTTDLEKLWGMQFFTYFNNGTTPQGDPTTGPEFYNYLTGKFRDGNKLVYGGTGVPVAGGANIPTRYCYPGESDPLNKGTNGGKAGPPPSNLIAGGWKEDNNGSSKPNAPADRRFVQSAGPFKLWPGARNYITTGVPFAIAKTPKDPKAALPLLKIADIKAQNLFDACFVRFEDIDPPSVKVTEVDNGFHCYLYNLSSSNNYGNKYQNVNPDIEQTGSKAQRSYTFEGYIVYQLKEKAVSNSQLDDPSKAKPVFITNVKNGVTSLVNYVQKFNDIKQEFYFEPQTKVLTSTEGIKSNFFVTKDEFGSESSPNLTNEKTYYYAAVAYSYNNFKNFNIANPFKPGTNNLKPEGQNIPFRASASATFFSIVPHKNTNTLGAEVLDYSVQNQYLPVTRLEGQGGGLLSEFKFDAATENLFATQSLVENPVYQPNTGPVIVRVIDPAKLSKSEFKLKLGVYKNRRGTILSIGDDNPLFNVTTRSMLKDTTSWQLTNITTGSVYTQPNTIAYGDEFYIPEEGIAIKFKHTNDYFTEATGSVDEKADFFNISIDYKDPSKEWLSGIKDLLVSDDNIFIPDNYFVQAEQPENWILAGKTSNRKLTASNPNSLRDYTDINIPLTTTTKQFIDPNKITQKTAIDGWAPYCFAGHNNYLITATGVVSTTSLWKGAQPAMDMAVLKVRHREITRNRWKFLANVDLVFTNDKSKWTRCPVVEMGNFPLKNKGGVMRHKLRAAPSVDKEGSTNVGPDNNDYPTSMGWFPGYAINLSTGERLNIVFSEDSRDSLTNNGGDLVWNPTSVQRNILSSDVEDKTVWGGKHYIYIFGHNGDTKFDNRWGTVLNNKRADVDRYDAGKSIYDILSYTYPNAAKPDSAFVVYKEVWKDAMYVGLPLIDETIYSTGGFVDLTNPKKITIPTETRISFRVNDPLKYGYSGVYGNVAYNPTSDAPEIPLAKANYTVDKNLNPINGNLPMYGFSTKALPVPTKVELTEAKSALDLINVVPNPYYSGSEYETNRLENIVKITNLPEKCDVKIYTMNGQLVREYPVDNTKNKTEVGNQNLTVNWDLKNFNNIPISSGLYLIYVKVPGVGERVIKWFGTIRPTDLNTF